MEKVETLDFDEKPKKKKKLKKWVKILLSIITIVIVVLAVIMVTLSYLLSAPLSKSQVVDFKIESGLSVYSVGEKLKKEGIIRNYFAYKTYVKIKGINGYKAGIYKLDKSLPVKDIVSILTGNYYKENGITITFKEGKTIRGVAKEIAKKTNIKESEVYAKLEDKEYIDSLISKYWFLTDKIKNNDIYYPLEGYLFPDTYTFSENVTISQILEIMLDQSDKVFSKYKSLIDASSYNINDIVTLASLVEQEGIYEKDRKQIAGVFYNRLNAGMSLGSDVTTYYAFKIDLGSRDLTKEEINTYNPYNTRGPKMAGKLPVGAISNFGESSLDAVLNPIKSDYYYFVADKQGNTYFTKTYEEHQKTIKQLKETGNWLEW